MKLSLLILMSFLLLSSCTEDGKKYTGTFRNIDKTAFTQEFKVRRISGNKYQISFLNGMFIADGLRKKNIITATVNELPNSPPQIFEFSPDGNTISLSFENRDNIETFIRVR